MCDYRVYRMAVGLMTLISISFIAIIPASAGSVLFISPTKINESEAWGVNNTEIRVQTDETFSTAPILYWQPTRGSEKRIDIYIMNQINSTAYNYSFSNLNDGDYFYYVAANLSVSGNLTTSTYYVTINFDPDQAIQSVYLYQDAGGQYISNTTTSWSGYTFVEPEWIGWSSTVYPYTQIVRCYNVTTGKYYDNDTTCQSGETSVNLSKAYEYWNPYLVQLKRYVNATGHTITVADRNPPAGYTLDKSLGWVMAAFGQQENYIYMNNTKIRFGIDKKYGGAVFYLASMDDLSNNVINNFDCPGRQIQSSYYDAGNSSEVYQQPGYWGDPWGWNPTLAGNIYGQPSNVSSVVVDELNKTMIVTVDKVAHWNPSYNNGRWSNIKLITTYKFDGENPVMIINYTYIHSGNVTHYWGHEIPTIYLNKPFTVYKIKNNTGLYTITVPYGSAKYIGDPRGPPVGENEPVVYSAALNNSDFGVGLWHNRATEAAIFNGSLDSADGTPWSAAWNKLSSFGWFYINKTGENGYIGSNIARVYLGNITAMDSYFNSLNFSTNFDPATPVNRTLNQSYIYVRINAANNTQIQDATLIWTNSTGTYYLAMTVSGLKDNAYINMIGLSIYNYNYKVTANATTGVTYSTPTVWTNLVETGTITGIVTT